VVARDGPEPVFADRTLPFAFQVIEPVGRLDERRAAPGRRGGMPRTRPSGYSQGSFQKTFTNASVFPKDAAAGARA
jgi:hypothetical protein